MSTDERDSPQIERVTQGQSVGSRGSENGNSPSSTQSPKEHSPHNDAASEILDTTSATNDATAPPDGSPDEINSGTGRPSRRIRPVSQHRL